MAAVEPKKKKEVEQSEVEIETFSEFQILRDNLRIATEELDHYIGQKNETFARRENFLNIFIDHPKEIDKFGLLTEAVGNVADDMGKYVKKKEKQFEGSSKHAQNPYFRVDLIDFFLKLPAEEIKLLMASYVLNNSRPNVDVLYDIIGSRKLEGNNVERKKLWHCISESSLLCGIDLPNIVVDQIVVFTRGTIEVEVDLKLVAVQSEYSSSYTMGHYNSGTGYWCSSSGSARPWCQLELEREIQISRLEFFSDEGAPKEIQIFDCRKSTIEEPDGPGVGMECKCLYRNGNYYMCAIVEQHDDLFTVNWHDGDTADRIDHPVDHFILTKQVDLANDTLIAEVIMPDAKNKIASKVNLEIPTCYTKHLRFLSTSRVDSYLGFRSIKVWGYL